MVYLLTQVGNCLPEGLHGWVVLPQGTLDGLHCLLSILSCLRCNNENRLSVQIKQMYNSVLKISHHITSHHITSHHITSHHITSHHITSHHITSHHITSAHMAFCCSALAGPSKHCRCQLHHTGAVQYTWPCVVHMQFNRQMAHCLRLCRQDSFSGTH